MSQTLSLTLGVGDAGLIEGVIQALVMAQRFAHRVETRPDASAACIIDLSARTPYVEMSLDAARTSAYATPAG